MAMNGIAVSLHGWEELGRALANLSEETAIKAGNSAARAGTNHIKTRIVEQIPLGPGKVKLRRNKRGDIAVMDYGHLRDNIKVRPARKRTRQAMNAGGYYEFTISPGAAFWGKFLEFGTVKMPATPIWRNTFDSETDAAVAKVGEVLLRAINRAARRRR